MTKSRTYRLAALAAGLLCGTVLAPAQVVGWGDNSVGETNVPPGAYKAVAAGSQHALGLTSAGTVAAWGNDAQGQATVPTGLSLVNAVAAGLAHSLALVSGGTVVAWGDNTYGQTTVPANLTGVIAIAAGDNHSLALLDNGTVVAWGANNFNQTVLPPSVTQPGAVSAIAGGSMHSLALLTNGTVVAWGSSSSGALNVPKSLESCNLANAPCAIAIAANSDHDLALMSDGTVVAWGSNHYGESTVPPGMAGVIAIAAGNYHSVALKDDGIVVQWGDTSRNQGSVPSGLNPVTAVAAGGDFTLALQAQYALATWGEADCNTPVPAGSYKALASGNCSSWGLTTTGQVLGWGTSTIPIVNAEIELPPTGLTNMKAIANGSFHGLALKSDGTVVQWGETSNGEGAVPPGLSGVVTLAAGGYHSLALRSDGTVVGWGAGEADVPTGLSNVVAIADGGNYGLALKSDGTIVGWGDDSSGQINTGNLTHVTALSAGAGYALIVKSDSSAVTLGSGVLQPVPQTDVMAAAAGENFALVLRSDGTLIGWGNDFDSVTQVSNLAGVTNLTVAANSVSPLALTTNLPTGTAIPITIASTGSVTPGIVVAGNGCAPGTYTPPVTLNWSAKASCTITLNAPQPPAGTQYVFDGWADGATTNPRTIIAPPAANTFTASFTTQYQLTTAVSPSGAGTVTGGGAYYDPNSIAPITATANASYQFVNWTGSVAQANSTSTTVSMTAPQTVTANFQLIPTITLSSVTGPALSNVIVNATVGPPGQAFTGNLQFQVAGQNAAGPAPVTGAGNYNISYPISQGAGQYPISAVFTSTSPTVASLTVGGATLTVTAATQTITWATIAAQSVGAQVTLSATAPGGTVTFAATASDTGICTVSGKTATMAGAGSCTITASQAGNSIYAPATVSQTFTVNPQTQTITWATIPTQVVGAQVALSATAPGGTVTFAATASDTSICTVSGNTATMTGAGSCTITASQAGNAIYSPAMSSQTFAVNQQTQTITWATIAAQLVGAQVTLSASAPGGTVTFAATTADAGICMVSGNTATMTGAGSCTISASQAGNATYSPVSTSQTFSVNRQTQIITWAAIGQQLVGAQVALTASAPGGPVTFAATAADASICTVLGNTATMIGAGSCTITASQAGNATYSQASTSQTFSVNLQTQAITWAPIAPQLVGAQVTLSATAPGGAVIFAVTASDTGICAVSGTTASMTGAGSCTITASQAGSAMYAPASVSQTFTVTQPAPASNFTITPIPGSETINRGVLAAFLLELQSVNKFNGSVKLTCSGGPAGAVCANLPQTVKVNGTALAVSGILFPANTKSGTYTMTFTGVSGSLTNSATASFTVK